MFLKTVDGGVTWTNPVSFSERLFNVCFLNSTTGWVMGKNGMLSKTLDGGITWNQLNITGEDINCMRFFNSTKGLMVCGGGEIYLTMDGGVTWSRSASTATEDLISIAIRDQNAWICGTAGTLLYSPDEGQNWTVQTAGINIDFNDISFSASTIGYTAGIAGLMNKTDDAGINWQNHTSNCLNEITGISVPAINHGWFCTSNGDLYSLVAPTGVNEKNEESPGTLSVFPNPSSESIQLTLEGNDEFISSVQLFDMTGSQWLEQIFFAGTQKIYLSLKILVAGIYFAEIHTGNRKYVAKVIKSN